MNRLRDYLAFAVCFAGLGYIAMWPLSVNGNTGALFGASIFCRAPAPFVLAVLCRGPHPLTLSPTLHVLGALSAAAFGVRLLYGALCRALRARAARMSAVRVVRIPANLMTPTRPSAPPPRLPRVKRARREFGLRGAPR
jgi:hypothetical protein